MLTSLLLSLVLKTMTAISFHHVTGIRKKVKLHIVIIIRAYCMILCLVLKISILYQYTWKTFISFSSPLRLISKPLSSARVPSSLKTAYRFLIKIPSSLEAGRIIAYIKEKPYKSFKYTQNSGKHLNHKLRLHFTLYGPSTSNSIEHSL